MNSLKTLVKLWPLHVLVLVVSIVSQLIGVRAIPIGIGTIVKGAVD